jgi:hypothetical protein
MKHFVGPANPAATPVAQRSESPSGGGHSR